MRRWWSHHRCTRPGALGENRKYLRCLTSVVEIGTASARGRMQLPAPPDVRVLPSRLFAAAAAAAAAAVAAAVFVLSQRRQSTAFSFTAVESLTRTEYTVRDGTGQQQRVDDRLQRCRVESCQTNFRPAGLGKDQTIDELYGTADSPDFPECEPPPPPPQLAAAECCPCALDASKLAPDIPRGAVVPS